MAKSDMSASSDMGAKKGASSHSRASSGQSALPSMRMQPTSSVRVDGACASPACPSSVNAERNCDTEVKRGLFSRLPGFIKREEDPSPLEPPLNSHAHSSAPAGPEDRLQARISDAVKSRLRVEPAFEDAGSELQSHAVRPQEVSAEPAAGMPSQFALGEPR